MNWKKIVKEKEKGGRSPVRIFRTRGGGNKPRRRGRRERFHRGTKKKGGKKKGGLPTPLVLSSQKIDFYSALLFAEYPRKKKGRKGCRSPILATPFPSDREEGRRSVELPRRCCRSACRSARHRKPSSNRRLRKKKKEEGSSQFHTLPR